jgi:DNA-binding NarL/FixJ family response regulator
MAALRVLIIANDPLSRAGLAMLLSDQAGCEVVGQISGAEEYLADMEIYRPEVLPWDLGWNPEEALTQAAEFAVEWPLVGLLPDENQVGEAWAVGLRSLLLRSAPAEMLLAALIAAGQELVTLDPRLAETLLRSTPQSPPDHLIEALTPRELEVLQLLAEGLPNKDIARQLNISDHTVKFHVNAIMSKLNAQSRTEAVVQATRLGLILL